jgi:anti-anti-sigma factor
MTNRGAEGTATIDGLPDNHARFAIRSESAEEAVRLFLCGELDLASERIFHEQLKDLRGNGFSRMVFDLSELTFIDSTGLRLIIGEWERSRRDGYDFVLVKGPEAIQRVLAITGLEKVLPIADDSPTVS